jgi:hypothetical protein
MVVYREVEREGKEMILTGLPGVSQKSIEAGGFRTVEGAMRVIRDNRAGTAAGHNGAINIWIDDAGNFRGAFMQFAIIKDWFEGTTKIGLRQWLKTWIPKMER